VIVRVLGSAAGGGVPQWNCACGNCSAVRRGEAPGRLQSSFAVSADGARWWLINCSPDIARQIEATPALQPGATRGTPIAGMLLTDANIDHIGGLAVVRQSGSHAFTLLSSGTVRSIARSQPMCAPFFEPPHAWDVLEPGRAVRSDGLAFEAIPVDGLTPGYAGRQRARGAVIAVMVTDVRTATSALFAPVFASVDANLLAAVAKAKLAFVDGSFWSDDELSSVGVPKASQSLGHLPIDGLGGSLAALAEAAKTTDVYYCHVNNTNPVLDQRSDPARLVAQAGLSIADDGREFAI
jgi:pyrroloquinoline quinone biosynthesis protein B